jgi:hypothetical protein
MKDCNRFRLQAVVLLGSACVLGSCSQGPEPPRPGTPAFFWGAASTAWQAKDYLKTNDNLNQLVSGDTEYAARARVWQLVAASGLAEGYNEIADAYESGSRYNRTESANFREQIRLLRSAASQLSLQAAETFRRFLDKEKTPKITFDFAFAPMEPPVSALFAKLEKGILLKGAEAESLQTATLRRGVSRAAARAAGIKPDAADAAEAFRKEIPREQFLLATATSMVDQSRLYGPKKLDQPQRQTALVGLAEDVVRLVPASSGTKELQGKIKAATDKKRSS